MSTQNLIWIHACGLKSSSKVEGICIQDGERSFRYASFVVLLQVPYAWLPLSLVTEPSIVYSRTVARVEFCISKRIQNSVQMRKSTCNAGKRCIFSLICLSRCKNRKDRDECVDLFNLHSVALWRRFVPLEGPLSVHDCVMAGQAFFFFSFHVSFSFFFP